MRRDSIFYKLFQQFPSLLFELLQNPVTNANAYRFDSVAVKEPKFEIDGVVLKSFVEGNLPHKLFAFSHQKTLVLGLFIFVKCSFKEMNSFMKGYLQNPYYTFTVTARDSATGKQ